MSTVASAANPVGRTLRQLHQFAFWMVGLIVGFELLVYLIPAPSYVPSASLFRFQMVNTAGLSITLVVAALLFVYGLRDFKPEMRRSYQIIAASVALFGILNLQYPLLIYLNLVPGPWLAYGGSITIIIAGIGLHYIGTRHFGKTLGVDTKFASWPLLIMCTIVACAAVVFIPHRYEIPEFWYQLHQIICTFDIVWNTFIAGILIRSIQEVGPSYTGALKWLAAGAAGSALGFVQVFIVSATIGQNSSYNLHGFTAAPFEITGWFYIISGYLFCKIRFYGLRAQDRQTSGRPVLDAVINTARLVSNRREIDDILQSVRTITASLGAQQALSPVRQQTLLQVYLKLEDYLITRERLRTFTREGLRARLSDEVLALLPAA